jgi:hypothetical protein
MGVLNVYAAVCPLPPAPVHFLTVRHPSCLLLCCYSVTIRTFLAVPLCLSEAFHHVTSASRFLPPFHRCSYPESGLALHSSRLVSLHRVGDWLPHNVLALLLWGLAARSMACNSKACLRASFTVFSPPTSSWIFMVGSSTPSANALPASPYMVLR